MNQQASQQLNTPEKVLEWYEKEEVEFKNHWLWRELNTTPQDLFKKVDAYIQKNNVNQEAWKRRLAEAQAATKTRVNEQKERYQTVNLKMMGGLKV